MNATHEPRPWRRFLTEAFCCVAWLACFGCASYFRNDPMSYEELKERNQQQQEENKMLFKPGTVFYTQ